jgi:hypothetical protein
MKALGLVLGIALGVFTVGCKSDETTICERLDECNFLQGISVEDCEDEAEDIDDTGDCADCVEDEDCGDIIAACDDECSD